MNTRPTPRAVAAFVTFLLSCVVLAIYRPDWLYMMAFGAYLGLAIGERRRIGSGITADHIRRANARMMARPSPTKDDVSQ